MARNKYCDALKTKIINDFKDGITQSSIAKKYNINRSIISRLIKKYNATRAIKTLNLGSRPRKTTHRIDTKICNLIEKNPFITSKEVVKSLNLSVDSSTIRRRLLENNLKSYRPVNKPMLTNVHQLKRYRKKK